MAVYCHPRHWNHNLSSSVLRAEVDEKVHLALGCHPKQANLWNSSSSSKLENALETLRPQLVALGECGLDYSEGSNVPKEQQQKVFKQQILLAMKLQLPLVLHIRDAEEDGLRVLEVAGLPEDWPVHRHCFTGSSLWELLIQCEHLPF